MLLVIVERHKFQFHAIGDPEATLGAVRRVFADPHRLKVVDQIFRTSEGHNNFSSPKCFRS
jgi:hypothetical protein